MKLNEYVNNQDDLVKLKNENWNINNEDCKSTKTIVELNNKIFEFKNR